MWPVFHRTLQPALFFIVISYVIGASFSLIECASCHQYLKLNGFSAPILLFLSLVQTMKRIHETNSKTNWSSEKECVRAERGVSETSYQWCTVKPFSCFQILWQVPVKRRKGNNCNLRTRDLVVSSVGRRQSCNCNLETRDFWWQVLLQRDRATLQHSRSFRWWAQLENDRATTVIWEPRQRQFLG